MYKLLYLMKKDIAGWVFLFTLLAGWLWGSPGIQTIITGCLFLVLALTMLGWTAAQENWQQKIFLAAHETTRMAFEVMALREALLWCALDTWDGSDIDGGKFQKEMEDRGLLVEVPATQKIRDELGSDTMLTFWWAADPNSPGPVAETS